MFDSWSILHGRTFNHPLKRERAFSFWENERQLLLTSLMYIATTIRGGDTGKLWGVLQELALSPKEDPMNSITPQAQNYLQKIDESIANNSEKGFAVRELGDRDQVEKDYYTSLIRGS